MNRDAIFANWRDHAVVSYRTISGRLVDGVAKVWTRASDGKTFYRVRVDDQGDMWATAGWMLGVGHCDHVCGDCRCPFRSTDPRDAICGTCLQQQRQNDPTDRDAFTNLNGVGPKARSFAPGRGR